MSIRTNLRDGLTTNSINISDRESRQLLVNKYKDLLKEDIHLFLQALTPTQNFILLYICAKRELHGINQNLKWLNMTYAHIHNLIKIFRDIGIIEQSRKGREASIKLMEGFETEYVNALKIKWKKEED